MDVACNFTVQESFNIKYDLTWSFDYCMQGPEDASGGFTTFLLDANTPTLTGGGIRSGLGYGVYEKSDTLMIAKSKTSPPPPVGEQDEVQIAEDNQFRGFIRIADGDYEEETYLSGINGRILGAGFDSHGIFGVRDYGYTTGAVEQLANAARNSVSVRTGSADKFVGFEVMPFQLIQQQLNFKTLRFNVTNFGSILNIHYKQNVDEPYKLLKTFETGLLFIQDTYVKLGISSASPVVPGNNCKFSVRDLHFHGKVI